MKKIVRIRKTAAASALALLAGLSVAKSDQVNTVPVGFMTYTIPPTNSVQTTTTYISFPLLNDPLYTGPVSAVSANTLSVSGAPWTAGQFASAGAPYFVKIASGQQAGRTMLVTANTTNTITVDTTDHSTQTTALDTGGFAVQPNDRIEIILGDTLASLFGDNTANNPLLLVGGGSLLTADTIAIFNTSTKRFDGYYFNTTNNGWNSGASPTNLNGLVIYPETTVGITRRPNRPELTFQMMGRVPDVSPLTKTVGGNASVIYASTRFPVDMPLSSVNISGWTKNDSPLLADTLAVWNQATFRWDGYFQRSSDNQWRKVGDNVTDQSNFVIPAGMGTSLLKRTSVSAKDSFLAVAMPYTLN